MGFEIKPIQSIAEYLTRINDCIKKNDKAELIFRGQDRYFEPDYGDQDTNDQRFIKCGAKRRLEVSNLNKQNKVNELENQKNDLFHYTAYLINYSKMKRYHINGMKEYSYLELMAELQHFGAATILIDFTKNALVALYFACKSKPNNDGCVFVMNKSNMIKVNVKDFNENIDKYDDSTSISKHKPINNSTSFSKYISINNPDLYFWEPASLNMRIPAQHSIFIFGKPEINNYNDFIDIIRIDKAKKENILNDLHNLFNINDITLFNDLPGFALSNCVESKIDERLYFSKQVEIEQQEFSDKEIQIINDENKNNRNTYISDLYVEKGNIEYNNNNLEKAMEYYKIAIKFNNNNSLAYNNIGNIYKHNKKYNRAVRYYKNAINIEPRNYIPYANLGVVYNEQKKYKDVIKSYNNVIDINPKDYKAFANRGCAYANLEKYKNALLDFMKAIELNPKDYISYNNLAYTLMKLGSLDEALLNIKESIRLDPNNYSAYVTLGQIYQKMLKNEEALNAFNKGIILDTKEGESYYLRGKFFFEIGDKNKAEADFKKAEELGYKPPPNDK